MIIAYEHQSFLKFNRPRESGRSTVPYEQINIMLKVHRILIFHLWQSNDKLPVLKTIGTETCEC